MINSIEKRSNAAAAMVEAGAKGRALMGGTAAMRTAGETYLPRMEAEAYQDYRARLGMSWLFNGYRKTVSDMAGKVFDKPVEYVDAPGEIEAWLANIDMQGRDLSEFARELFKDAFSGPGIAYVMVEAPRRAEPVTRAQAERDNLRPYFIHIEAESVLGWKAEAIDNVMRLTQFRIMETVQEDTPGDEFGQDAIDQIRVLDRAQGFVAGRVFRKVKSEWVLYEEYTVPVAEIPIVPYYANRSGFMTGEPLLDDLADVNIAHWQSQSDQRNILHAARVPILFGAGFAEESGIVISTKAAMTTPDPQARLSWVEHSGQAIGAGRQDLKDLEFQMQSHGMQLLVERNDGGATGAMLDAKKETSVLAMTADALKDCLEQCFIVAAEFGGVQLDPVISVNKEYGVLAMTAQDFTAMLSAANTGNMSRRTFIAECQRRGMLSGDLNIDDELEEIDAEGMSEAPDLGDE